MRYFPFALLVAALLCPGAAAQTLDFTPVPVESASLGESMRTLAASALEQMKHTERTEATLGDFALLHMTTGQYDAAVADVAELRGLVQRNGSRPLFRIIAMEVFVRAKAKQLASKRPFEDTFAEAFAEVFATLGDWTAYDSWYFMGSLPDAFGSLFRAELAKHQAPAQLSLREAIDLARAYTWWQASASFFPLLDAAIQADDRRRYVVEDGTLVRTPDGATLSAIVVRPRSKVPLPALLHFTIYTYPGQIANARETAAHGYPAVIGFLRGKYKSTGRIMPFEKDGEDARTLIEWTARQPWSDGRVGMYGGSYTGFTQWAAAKRLPPALKAIMTSATVAPGIAEPAEGGIFHTYQYRWVPYTTSGPMLDEERYNDMKRWSDLDRSWYVSGRPYREMDRIDGTPNPIYRRWLDHPTYDVYWQRMAPYRDEFARIDIPVLQTTGYYDGGQVGTLHYFNEHRKHNPRANHTLLIGPYGHLGAQHQAQDVIEGYAIDPVARMNIHTLRYAWFDHVLKGRPRPEILKDAVNYQVMGANIWRHAPSIEAMAAGKRRLHLVDSALAAKPPSRESSVEMTIDLADRSDADWVRPTGVVVGKLDTHHALLFVSEPMRSAVELSGQVSGTLDFVVNKADVDFTIDLYELKANGEYVRLSVPYYQRASLLRDPSRRQLLVPGQRQQLSFVKPGPVSRLFRVGSRLVLLLGINKNRQAQVNYGTGKDVSDESIADAGVPLRVQWFSTSFVDLPVT